LSLQVTWVQRKTVALHDDTDILVFCYMNMRSHNSPSSNSQNKIISFPFRVTIHWSFFTRVYFFNSKQGQWGNFSLHYQVQTASGAHPAPYPIGTGGFYLGGKAAGAWRSLLTSVSCWG